MTMGRWIFLKFFDATEVIWHKSDTFPILPQLVKFDLLYDYSVFFIICLTNIS